MRPLHLAGRFLDVTLARRLRPGEQAEVAALLRTDAERSMYWDQPRADQRHGLAAARLVRSARPLRTDLVRAALLHDVGKRGSRLGPLGRSLATILGRLGIRGPARFAAYLDHGRIAARELDRAGAEQLVVDFALHHHRERPEGICREDWNLLQAADRAVLRRN
ncbi:MAG: hypothetical protein OXM57_09915 [bacterium]|nr:hypothetical protein [bacterium]MDE0352993.1 hypothetical protein [bacterium]